MRKAGKSGVVFAPLDHELPEVAGEHTVGGAGRLGNRLVRALLEPVQLALHLVRVRVGVRVRG